jgi:hypothetical protein
MRHLGWYEPSGQTTRRTRAWFNADGLDPGGLAESELFRSKAIEEVTKVLLVPAAICGDPQQLSAYLGKHGWNWSPQRPESTATPAIAARTTLNVKFWMEPAGLLVEFENFPILDPATAQWNASPRWPGFLLACGAPLLLCQKAGGWSGCIDMLNYTAEHLPWIAAEAINQRTQALDQLEKERVEALHQTAVERQETLKKIKARRRPLRVPPGDTGQSTPLA